MPWRATGNVNHYSFASAFCRWVLCILPMATIVKEQNRHSLGWFGVRQQTTPWAVPLRRAHPKRKLLTHCWPRDGLASVTAGAALAMLRVVGPKVRRAMRPPALGRLRRTRRDRSSPCPLVDAGGSGLFGPERKEPRGRLRAVERRGQRDFHAEIRKISQKVQARTLDARTQPHGGHVFVTGVFALRASTR